MPVNDPIDGLFVSDFRQVVDYRRPIIKNDDGSISTEETVTIESDGEFINIPTIVAGERVSEDEAIELFNRGQNNAVGRYQHLGAATQGAIDRSRRLAAERSATGYALPEGSGTDIPADVDGGVVPLENLIDPLKYLTKLPFGTIDTELSIGSSIIGPAGTSGIRSKAMSVAADTGWRNWQKLFAAFGADGEILDGTRALDQEEYESRMGILKDRYPWREGIIEAELEHNIVESKLTAWEHAVSRQRSWLDKGATATAAFILHGLTTPEVGGAIGGGILLGKLAAVVGVGVEMGAAATVGRSVLSRTVAKTGAKALSRPLMLATEAAGDVAFTAVYESAIAFQERRELSISDLSLYTAIPLALAARNVKVGIDEFLEARRVIREETLRAHNSAETLVRIIADSIGEEITEDSVKEIVPAIIDTLRRTGGKLSDDDLKAIPKPKGGEKVDVRVAVNNAPAQKIANAIGDGNPANRLLGQVDEVIADIGFPDIVAKALYRISQTEDEALVRAVSQGLLDAGLVSRSVGNIEAVIKGAAADYARIVNSAISDSVGGATGVVAKQKVEIAADGLGFIRTKLDDLDLRYGKEERVLPISNDAYSVFAQKTGINSIGGTDPEVAGVLGDAFNKLSEVARRMPESIREAVQKDADSLVGRLKKFVELSRACING